MTLKTSLQRALTRPMAKVIAGLGDPCAVRRPHALTQPDNSAAVDWRKVPGLEAPFPVLLATLSESDRRRSWGHELAADVQAYAPLAVAVQLGDILRPSTGTFAGQALEIVGVDPIDTGALRGLALASVPERPDYGF